MRQLSLKVNGPYAIDPKAFGMLMCETPVRENRIHGSVAIVSVYGALQHHNEGWADSYDDIVARCAAAFESSARDVVLDFTTPGGVVSGCRAAAEAIRRMADQSGKRLIGFANGNMCSAGYMLGVVCDQLWASPDAIVGSIGVLEIMGDFTKADAMHGVQYHLIASGNRKGDGMPGKPIDDEAVQAARKIVDGQAQLFFEWVAQHRPGLTPESVAGLEAATFLASEAAANGLIDRVGTFADLMLALATSGQVLTKGTENNMASKVSKILADLRSIAEGDDEVEAAVAKKMLEGYGDKPEAADDAAPEDEPAAPADDAPKSEPPGASDASALAVALKATNAQLAATNAQLASMREEREIEKLLATRPDFSAETLAELKGQPLAIVQFAVRSMPKGAPVAAVQTTRTPTAGAGTPGGGGLTPEQQAELDSRMGTGRVAQVNERSATKLTLGKLKVVK